MTSAQIAANRAAAVATVRAQLGLTGIAFAMMTLEQRNAYNNALAAYISSRPEQFSDQDALNAAVSLRGNEPPPDDDSFQVGEFVAETFRPLGEAAQSVGDGVLSVANAARWAIPLLAVVAVIVLAEKFSGGTAISSLKKIAK